jgi:hypothetical protein
VVRSIAATEKELPVPNRVLSSATSGRAGAVVGERVAVRVGVATGVGAAVLDGAVLDGAVLDGAVLDGAVLAGEPAAPARRFDPDALPQPAVSNTAPVASAAVSRLVPICGSSRTSGQARCAFRFIPPETVILVKSECRKQGTDEQ